MYILHSETLNKFYVGHSQDLKERVLYHNSGYGKYTKKGVPWQLIWHKVMCDRSEAMKLEMKIKKIGAQRFLKDLQEL